MSTHNVCLCLAKAILMINHNVFCPKYLMFSIYSNASLAYLGTLTLQRHRIPVPFIQDCMKTKLLDYRYIKCLPKIDLSKIVRQKL